MCRERKRAVGYSRVRFDERTLPQECICSDVDSRERAGAAGANGRHASRQLAGTWQRGKVRDGLSVDVLGYRAFNAPVC